MPGMGDDIERRVQQRAQPALQICINDLREKYYNNIPLATDELRALTKFDELRIEYLNNAQNEEEFQRRYLEMQAKANLSPFTEFL